MGLCLLLIISWLLQTPNPQFCLYLEPLGDGTEGSAVDGAGAEAGQGLQVVAGGIALVAGEAVAGIFAVEGGHFAIPGDLGEDRCGGDCGDTAVTADDGFGSIPPVGTEVAVDVDESGLQRKLLHGTAHGEQAGLEDVETVYFRGAGSSDGETEAVLNDPFEAGFPLRRSEFLRVVQALDRRFGIENHRRGNHVAGQTTAAGFVRSGPRRRQVRRFAPDRLNPHVGFP